MSVGSGVIAVLVLALVFLPCLLWFLVVRSQVKIPTPYGLPILGNLLNLVAPVQPGEEFRLFAEKHNTALINIDIGSYPCVIPCGVQALEDSGKEEFLGRMHNFSIMNKWLGGDHLVLCDPPEFHNIRDLVARGLQIYGGNLLHELIDSEVNSIVDTFMAKCKDEKPFQAYDSLYYHMTNLLARLSIGVSFETGDKEREDIIDNFNLEGAGVIEHMEKFTYHSAQSIGDWIPCLRSCIRLPQELPEIAQKYQDILRPPFDEHIKDLGERKQNPRDLVDIILDLREQNPEKYGEITDDTIFGATVLDFQLAAVNTLARLLDWMLVFLVNNEQLQERLYNHILEQSPSEPTHEKIHNLNLVHAFCKELLRIMPVSLFSIPHRALRDGTIAGYKITRNTMVLPNLWAIHHTEELWPQHNRFDIDRFKDDNMEWKETHRDDGSKWVPFGYGQRICPGRQTAMEVVISVLARLVYNFTFHSIDGKKLSETGNGFPQKTVYDGIIVKERRREKAEQEASHV